MIVVFMFTGGVKQMAVERISETQALWEEHGFKRCRNFDENSEGFGISLDCGR